MTISGEVNVRQGVSSEANVRHGISGDLQMPRIVGGGSITVDSELSSTSENPVQNKVITAVLNEKQNIPDNEGTTGQVLTKTDQGAIWEDTNIPDSAWVHKTASGDIATFDDGADNEPVKQLTVSIAPIQSGSGTPSAENVRPISGWTGAEVTRTGKNLSPVNTIEALQWVTDNQTLLAFINTLKEGVYTVSFKSTLTSLNSGLESKTWITGFTWTNSGGNFSHQIHTNAPHSVGTTVSGSKTLTIDSTKMGKFTHAYCYGAGNNYVGAIGTGTLSEIQLELGSTATEYEPYTGTTLPIIFPSSAGTVYGGSLDVLAGTLTVTHGQISSYNGETLPGAWISDRDVYTAGTTPTTGAQVVYELAEPVVYQLTPEQVETLLGVNNIWADCGSVEVTYNADATLSYAHLDQDTAKKSMLARVEDGMTATQNYTTGDLLIVEDTLYRVTAAIPNGGAITLGTNVTATTMAAEIAASGGGGGSSITVDSELTSTSENPVQNKVIKAALDAKATATSVPVSGSVSNAGVLSFANSDGTQLFTVQLPLYSGGVD